MIRSILNSLPTALLAALLLTVPPAFAGDDPDTTEINEPTDEIALDALEVAEEAKFEDRVLLVETLDRYGSTALAHAQSDLADAEQALAEAIAAGDQEKADLLTNEVIPKLEEEVTRNVNFTENVAVIVDGLSEEQVIALNRALQNTRSNGIVPTMGLDELQRILDEEFNGHQIHAFVKAYRENAKFLAKAERFEVGSMQYERALAKAQNQQEKFLGKVDRFAEPSTTDALALSLATKEARKHARHSARHSADLSAKHAAKGYAKNEARRAAKQQAVSLAKQERAKESKGLAKGKNK